MKLNKYRLGDIAEVVVSSVDKKTNEGEIAVKLCNFVDVYRNWSITKSLAEDFMIASANESEIKNYRIEKGQVAITKDSETRDDIGISTYIADDFSDVLLGYHCALISSDKSVMDGRYLNAFLHTSIMQRYFENNASGSGQRYTLSTKVINDIPVLLPTLKNQRCIGKFFSYIDRKIELNKAINHNLETMAKQLYDYWFVQFDFPDEMGRPYKSSGGKMVWNDKLKREIPEGWCVLELKNVVSIKNGATPSTKDDANYGGDIVWITPKDLSNQRSKFVYQGERNITLKGYNSCSTRILPKGTVLLTSRAPIGIIAIAKEELCTNQGFKNLVPHKDFDTNYLYYYIKQHTVQIEKLGARTTFKEVSKEDLYSFPILTCGSNTKIFREWGMIMDSITDNQYKLTRKIECLTKLRDELLPLLMNGQASVNYDL